MSHFIPDEPSNPEFMRLEGAIYAEQKRDWVPKLASARCFLSDWVDEPNPLRNSLQGVEGVLQSMYDLDLLPDFKDFLTDYNAKLRKHTKPNQTAPLPPKRNVLVFGDCGGLCEQILEGIDHLGRVRWVEDTGDLEEVSDEKEIGRALGEVDWDLIVFGRGLDMPETNDVEDIHASQDRANRVFMTLCKLLMGQKIPNLAVLTRNVFRPDEVRHIAHGFLFGLCNTARLEMPHVQIQYIDTDRNVDADLLAKLRVEIFDNAGFGTNNVCLYQTGRRVNRQRLVETGDAEFCMPTTGVILITGGNGALGLLMGEWLLEQYAAAATTRAPETPSLVIKFLSRSLKISDETTWAGIERRAGELGVVCEQDRCDTSSRESVDTLFQKCEGRVSGIIHSAGVLQDALLTNQTWEKCCNVFAPKSKGALYMHDALERYGSDLLQFFWMFSSVAVGGNPGQTPYSASNAVLDALARYRLAHGLPGLAIQWGGWGEVGMAKNMDALARKRVDGSMMPMFTNKEGFDGLRIGLSNSLPGFSVFKYNDEVLLETVKRCKDSASCSMRNFVQQICPIPSFDKANYWQQLLKNLPHYAFLFPDGVETIGLDEAELGADSSEEASPAVEVPAGEASSDDEME